MLERLQQREIRSSAVAAKGLELSFECSDPALRGGELTVALRDHCACSALDVADRGTGAHCETEFSICDVHFRSPFLEFDRTIISIKILAFDGSIRWSFSECRSRRRRAKTFPVDATEGLRGYARFRLCPRGLAFHAVVSLMIDG